jgi:hypothetical protein
MPLDWVIPTVVVVVSAIFVVVLGGVAMLVRRNAHLWLPRHLAEAPARRRRRAARGDVTDVMFAFVDHFEPVLKPGQNPRQKAGAMENWCELYPKLAARHRDSDGCPPRRTWSFPFETYRPEIIEPLLGLCRQGLGEIEAHIHHQDDTSDSFRAKMLEGLRQFASHGLFTVPGKSGHCFNFVHGNWTLDNSSPDGSWCGVNDELTVLRELGCYADFTLPSAPSPTQTRKSNAIYYATDDPHRPKSHDTGVDVQVGREPSGDLMIVQGPLLLDWSNRKLGVFPRIDNAEVTTANPGRPERIDAWVRAGIGVIGRPEWVFIKVHAHGANACDRNALLGEQAEAMFGYLESAYGAGAYRLHYVTAREMYNIIKAAEAGKTGNPAAFRDFAIPPYSGLSEG